MTVTGGVTPKSKIEVRVTVSGPSDSQAITSTAIDNHHHGMVVVVPGRGPPRARASHRRAAMVQNGDGVRWQCHVAVMVWCGDNVGAGRMPGGRDANVGGQS